MSSTDKTSEKMLASIRKTKESDKPVETAPAQPAAKPAAKKAPVKKKAPARKAPATKPAARKAPATGTDPFQAARRVWPD